MIYEKLHVLNKRWCVFPEEEHTSKITTDTAFGFYIWHVAYD